jgi:uncharacterized protein (TIGR03435 family)
MRDMDVLVLEVDHPDATGLKPGTPVPPGQPQQGTPVIDGELHYRNEPISTLARHLEWGLKIPVVDHTGLTGNYDMIVPDNFGTASAGGIEEARRVLLDDFGLKLVTKRQPHKAFVIEKVK